MLHQKNVVHVSNKNFVVLGISHPFPWIKFRVPPFSSSREPLTILMPNNLLMSIRDVVLMLLPLSH